MSFSSVSGQDKAVEILKDEIKNGRISHAYLFSGQGGLGKKKLALEFAKAVFCSNKKLDSCDSCISCRKVDHSNHPDLKTIVKAEDKSAISIDQIRELKKEITYKPYESDRKIYIIEDADLMTKEAANSLLKTLEEPPEFATIILLVEDEGKLLPTIVSRCQKVKLTDVSAELIKDILLKKDLPQDKAEILSYLAEGSPGRAVKFAENESFFEKRKSIYNFIAAIDKKTTVEIFSAADQFNKLINNDFPFFYLLSNWYRDIIMFKQNYEQGVKNIDYLDLIKKSTDKYTEKNIMDKLEYIELAKKYIDSNVRKDLALEVLLFKLRQLEQK
ncbi:MULTISPECIES: DNA polymerase III subunit delta' [unclassified Halanaerobium]|uniref:DNA polymerase III subunit delta' n=1 Tax=unclassified Halanaerobium TaxID=2641197 RepID=UPI000DF205C1|nr:MULTISPECIES: DNA polymerase III subunit delta' [unclassified Halanaerobium]RCW50715.1 DNA polymerase III delta prime subunit [Halanaerobium sp. MA284_MarDTE_T2]RCW86883.1 DNA polymerase III delta prime subunit [Halanaerobium sp. DL-01]